MLSTKVIITFLNLILTLDNFVFNCTHYLKIMGCVRRTICALSYANIFMANFEAKHVYLWIKKISLLYLKYIDDILIIRKDTKTDLMTFIKVVNGKHKTIKFDFEISPKNISFFYIRLYKNENNNIQTTLYHKPTDQQAYLHNESEHSRSLNSIGHCQAPRLKTVCSTTIIQNIIRIVLSLNRGF